MVKLVTTLIGTCLVTLSGVLLAYKLYLWWAFGNWLNLPGDALYESVAGQQPQLLSGGIEGSLRSLLGLDLVILFVVPGILFLLPAIVGKWKDNRGTQLQLSRIKSHSPPPPIAE